jgi:transposase InsO family protein
MAVLALTRLPYEIAPGSPLITKDQRVYHFDRVDPDGAVCLRGRFLDGHGDLMVIDDDGHRRRPNCEEFLGLIAAGSLERLPLPPSNNVACERRKDDIDPDQARLNDELADFRVAMLRELDAKIANEGQSLSDKKLQIFIDRCLHKKGIRDLKGAWRCSPATLREWSRTRGVRGDRRLSDGVSQTGKIPRARKINHPIEILAFHTSIAISRRWPTSQAIRAYRAELEDINKGRPLARNLAFIDEDGRWAISNEPAVYETPDRRYSPISNDAFYGLVRVMRSKKAYAIETSAKGAMQRYEGGGVTEMPSRIGVLGQMDDTPVPNLFLVDANSGIPLGAATLTVLLDTVSRLATGWDLSWDHASTGTVLRTVLHANQPKQFPPAMLKMAEEEGAGQLRHLAQQTLTWGYKISRIKSDNLAAFHSRDVEDALLDCGIAQEFTGKDKPRAKPHIERILGILQNLLFKRLPDARPAPELAIRFGYDPDKHVLCTLQQARELLDLACVIYNLTRHTGLDGKQPSLVHQEHLARYKVAVIEDQEILRRALCRGEKEIQIDNSGIRVFNRRYSSSGLVAKIIQDHERGTRHRCRNGGPRQARFNRNHKRKLTFKVRIKYNSDDLGHIYVWNPHASPRGEWIILPCTDPQMKGRPKWLHDRIGELANEQADGHLDKATEDRLYALLQHEIMHINEASSERSLRDHARVIDTPSVTAALQNWVEVHSETTGSPDVKGLASVSGRTDKHLASSSDLRRSAAFPVDVDQTPRKDALSQSPRPPRAQHRRGHAPISDHIATPSRAKTQKRERRKYSTPKWKDIA